MGRSSDTAPSTRGPVEPQDVLAPGAAKAPGAGRGSAACTGLGNRLLAALPPADRARVAAQLEMVELPAGRVLFEPRVHLDVVHFPANCIVTLLQVMRDGATAEVALVGNDGMIGVSALLSGKTMPTRAQVLVAGTAYRLRCALLREEFRRGGALQARLLCHLQLLLTQTIQNVACCRRHSLHQQLARWLLLGLDRLPSREIRLTQETIASLLGVRREGVTEAARALRAAGAIDYSRGRITVLDRARLEAEACECYATVRREEERLMG